MYKVRQGKEIVLKVNSDIGILGEVAKLVSERGVSVEAVAESVDIDRNLCTLRLITDDNLRTCDILREHRYDPKEESVVLFEVPHKPGMLRKLTQLLGEEEIVINSLYATAGEKDSHCLMVLRTSNDSRALVCLSEILIETV